MVDRFSMKLLSWSVFALAAQVWLVQGQPDTSGLSCPPGYNVLHNYKFVPGYYCSPDPCYKVNPCGAGNTCTSKYVNAAGSDTYYADCTCNASYKSATVVNGPFFYSYTVCYMPGQDVCNPNPCKNGGTCSYQTDKFTGQPLVDDQGTKIDFFCSNCNNALDKTCGTPPSEIPAQPRVTATVGGITGPLAEARFGPLNNACPNSPYDVACLYNDGAHYICCDSKECGPIGPDGNTPICRGSGVTPSPNNYPPAGTPPSGPTPPSGDQGVCGTGDAGPFPTRCWFNSDPQGRYVCCDGQGCDGFNADNLTPHCKNYGYVPPNYGVSSSNTPSTPPSTPPSGSQGVCGSGAAAAFPVRCWFNSDPQGRYVCCDTDGCDGFLADNLFPHCKTNGYVPPGYGV